MECWILYDGEAESSGPGAYEVRRFIEAGKRQNINVTVFRPEQFELVVTQDDRDSILVNGQTAQLPDFILPRISGHVNYFTLAVIRHLERLGVQAFNGSETIDAVKDKLHTQQILAENNIPVPATMLAKFPCDTEIVERIFDFPLVVKTLVGTHGNGVFLCETKEKLKDIMELLKETKPDIQMIFQEFISYSHGRDLRVFVIDGEAVAAMQRTAQDGSFKANASRGAKVEQYPMNEEIRRLAIDSARTLNLDIAGVDILFDGQGGYKICEANVAPDFRALESCCNISIADEILSSISRRLKKQQGDESVFSFPALARQQVS